MIAGVGIIGVLASLLSSLLIGPPAPPVVEKTLGTSLIPTVEFEITEIKNELVALRQLMESKSAKNEE
jgi:hypothetical protein